MEKQLSAVSAETPQQRNSHGSHQSGRKETECKPDPNEQLYRTDEFRMYLFKVVPCQKRQYHDWTTCPFSHMGEKAKRRDPKKFKYTGIACPDMKKNGKCSREDDCPFAHNVFEYWLHPTRYRSQLCNDGAQCRRKVCFFAHSVEELRYPGKSGLDDPNLEILPHETDPFSNKASDNYANELFKNTSGYDEIAQSLGMLLLDDQQNLSGALPVNQHVPDRMSSRALNNLGNLYMEQDVGFQQQDPTAQSMEMTLLLEQLAKQRTHQNLLNQTYQPVQNQQYLNYLQQQQHNPQVNMQALDSQLGTQTYQRQSSVRGVQDYQSQFLLQEQQQIMKILEQLQSNGGEIDINSLPPSFQEMFRRHSIDTSYAFLHRLQQQNYHRMLVLQQQRRGTSLDIPSSGQRIMPNLGTQFSGFALGNRTSLDQRYSLPQRGYYGSDKSNIQQDTLGRQSFDSAAGEAYFQEQRARALQQTQPGPFESAAGIFDSPSVFSSGLLTDNLRSSFGSNLYSDMQNSASGQFRSSGQQSPQSSEERSFDDGLANQPSQRLIDADIQRANYLQSSLFQVSNSSGIISEGLGTGRDTFRNVAST